MNQSTMETSHVGGSARRITALCFLIAVLEGYDLQVISSAGPGLQKALGLSHSQIGLFFSSSLVGLAIGAICGGWLADRFGRKPVLIASVFAMGLFTFGTAFSSSFDMILLTRVLAGAGLGGAMPTLIAIMAETAGQGRTTSSVTTMICGQPLGGILSGIAGRAFGSAYGWESLFLLGGIATILIVPLLIRFLPETRTQQNVGALPRLAVFDALFGDGRTRRTLLLWLLFILTLALLSILLSWTPLLVMGKGLDKQVGINAIIAMNLGGIGGGLLASRLIDRFGARWPMLALYGLMALSLYLFSIISSAPWLTLVALLVGFSVLGAQFSLYGLAPRLYPLEGRGAGVGMTVAMGRIGSVLGPIAVGGLLAGGSSAMLAVQTLAPIALLASIALVVLTGFARDELSARQ